MGKRGFPPAPAEIQELRGDPSKIGRKALAAKARFAGDVVPADTEPFEWLPERAQAEWRRVLPELVVLRILRRSDLSSFAQMCVEYSIYRDALDAMQAGLTSTSKNAHGGMVRLKPEVSAFRQAASALEGWYDTFGMTPAGRMRLADLANGVGKPKAPINQPRTDGGPVADADADISPVSFLQ